MPIIDVSQIQTSPGSDESCSFSPPSEWKGDAADYMNLMRERYRDIMHGQRIYLTASYAKKNSVNVTGPYADEAMKIIKAIGRK